jgi:hypothetical protein
MSKNTCGDYANPAKQYQKMCGGSRSRKQQKKVGGTMQYPFEPEFHNYPIPNKVDFKVENATNMINDVDMFGCKSTNVSHFSSASMKGGDCGCVSSSMKLGGTIEQQQKKHIGAGYGYTMNLQNPITNRAEVDRYPTDSQCAGGAVKKNKYLLDISRQDPNHSSKNVGMRSNQKGGSQASDSLMNYFLDFQHRCRGSEIY